METAEVRSAPCPSRRLAKAVALLVSGIAAHMWIGGDTTQRAPAPGLRSSPAAVAQQATTGTSGSAATAAGVLALTSTLGRVRDEDARADAAPKPASASDTQVSVSVVPRTAPRAPVQFVNATATQPVARRVDRDPAVIGDTPEWATSVASARIVAPLATALPAVLTDEGSVAPASKSASENTESAAAAVRLPDETLVAQVLQQYRTAYEQLDVSAARHVWPTVDAEKLDSAFRQLAGQRLVFQSCGVTVSGSGDEATARCHGSAEYVPKVGSRRAVATDAEWMFTLAKQDASWLIVNANATIK